MHYPEQFEIIRRLFEIDPKTFILSIGSLKTWSDNSGGKKALSFLKSQDEKYVFKLIHASEFQMLQSFVESYFNHFFDRFNFETKKYESLLCPILGVFEIKVGNLSYYYMIMENLFYNQSGSMAYDLKGSQNNRLVKKSSDH